MNMQLVSKFLGVEGTVSNMQKDEKFMKEIIYNLVKRDIALLKKETDILDILGHFELFEYPDNSMLGIDMAISLVLQEHSNNKQEIVNLLQEATTDQVMRLATENVIDNDDYQQRIDQLAKNITNLFYDTGIRVRNSNEEEKIKIFFNYFNKYMKGAKVDYFNNHYGSYLDKEVVNLN